MATSRFHPRRIQLLLAAVALTAIPLALLALLGPNSEGPATDQWPTVPPIAATDPEKVELARKAEPITVVAAGDIACDPQNPAFNGGRGTSDHCAQHRTANLIERIDPDAVFALGDLQYDDGSLADFRAVYDRSWGRFYDITYPIVGNHEYGSGDPQGYFDYFDRRPIGDAGEGWYSFRIGHWEVYALNANCSYPYFQAPSCERGSEQWVWLRDSLRQSRAVCQLAMWHEPRVSSGPHGSYPRLEPLWRLVDEAGVELVLSGHDHLYERFAPIGRGGRPDPDGVRQFIVGVGGGELYAVADPQPGSEVRVDDRFGVLELELDEARFAWTYRAIEPDRELDSGMEDCT
ncbi:MAG: metallophosphoesterase [Actinomycetota bacterium]